MTHMAQKNLGQIGGRNTGRTPLLKGRYWFFTLNNYTKNDILALKSDKWKYLFQEETGKDGVKHLQGVIFLKNTYRLKWMKENINDKAHWEFVKRKKAAINYCMKIDTRSGKVYQNMGLKIPRKIIDDYLDEKPKDWQLDLLKIINGKVDKRKIYWYWDDVGGTGKSIFTLHLILKHNALAVSGSEKDIKSGVCDWIQEKELDIVVIDIPRGSYSNISYKAIEQLKNKFFYNTKYESKMCVFSRPHIIIFANSEPKTNMMSKDRWVIRKID